MTKVVLPKLLEKKGGVIVNLSSSAAELNPPMFSVYNATKVTFRILSWFTLMQHLHCLYSARNGLVLFIQSYFIDVCRIS